MLVPRLPELNGAPGQIEVEIAEVEAQDYKGTVMCTTMIVLGAC